MGSLVYLHPDRGQEPSGRGIVVSGAEIVEAEVGVILFAAIEVVIRRRAMLGKELPKASYSYLIGNYTSRVSKLAYASATIVDVVNSASRCCCRSLPDLGSG